MAVRIRLRIRAGPREASTVALVNTGFEAEEPSILLPKRLAERLGLYPPATSELVAARTWGAKLFSFGSTSPFACRRSPRTA